MRRWLARLLGDGAARVTPDSLPDEGRMPEFHGISDWLNSEPLTCAGLTGRVVLIDFWTLSCINCIHTLPHLNGWHDAYYDAGLTIVGIHTPEFGFERRRENVEEAIARHGIRFAVALDNDYAMWKAYRNHYWPALYFIDRKGRIRYHRFGEGNYAHSEAVLRALLSEHGPVPVPPGPTDAADETEVGRSVTQETFLGYERLEYLGSPEPVRMDAASRYSTVLRPATNVFYLDGEWEIAREWAAPRSADSSLLFRINAAAANLVMESGEDIAKVTLELDGRALRDDELGDDARNEGGKTVVTVKEGRMYSLLDIGGDPEEHELRLSFPEPGVKLYSFTFR